jgi:hypothetical protein
MTGDRNGGGERQRNMFLLAPDRHQAYEERGNDHDQGED